MGDVIDTDPAAAGGEGGVAVDAPETKSTPTPPPAPAKDPTAKAGAKGGDPAAAPKTRKSLLATPPAAPSSPKAGAGAPDKYTLVDSDGKALDEATTKLVDGVARQLGLSNEQAQAYVNHEFARIDAQQAKWRDEIERDPEIGGDRLQESLGYAARAKQLADPDMQSLLDGPTGDDPRVLRFLVKVGKALAPDRQRTASANDRPAITSEEEELRALYPSEFAGR